MRFGAVTRSGESLPLSEALLAELARTPCWLDGAVRVRLENRRLSRDGAEPEPPPRLDRPRLVYAMAVYFDPDASPEEAEAFQAMAGVLTPGSCPSELFFLTETKPAGWPP